MSLYIPSDSVLGLSHPRRFQSFRISNWSTGSAGYFPSVDERRDARLTSRRNCFSICGPCDWPTHFGAWPAGGALSYCPNMAPSTVGHRLFRRKTLENVGYTLAAARTIANWPSFLIDYVMAADGPRTYVLRDGTRIETDEAIDLATIGVVYLAREYGEVSTGWTVIDIGANIGIFSLYAARAGATVIAYEPMPENYRRLTDNVGRNSLGGPIKSMHQGVAGCTEKRILHVSGTGTGHSLVIDADASSGVEIDCVSLADVLTSNRIVRCDLLKMDCEGAELEILESASHEVLAAIERIRMEWHPNYDLRTLTALLIERGFTITRLHPDEAGRGMLWAQRDRTN